MACKINKYYEQKKNPIQCAELLGHEGRPVCITAPSASQMRYAQLRLFQTLRRRSVDFLFIFCLYMKCLEG